MTTSINDSLTSMSMALGRRQEQATYQPSVKLTDNQKELDTLWAENWIAQKVCLKRAEHMTRKWREIKSNDLAAEQLNGFYDLERRLKLQEIAKEACITTSLYGGCGVLILTNASVQSPLNSNQVIERLLVIKPNLIQGKGNKNTDILSVNFGKYDYYILNGQIEVHHSRLYLMQGAYRSESDNSLFGFSDLEGIYPTLKRFDMLSINIGELVTESKTDIFKISGLNVKLASGGAESITEAMSHIQNIKSITNCLLIDGESEYEQKELTFTGLKELLVEFRNAVAGAADMPVTILFGQSVSGLASGDEDIQNFHESIHALQESRLRPLFERLDPLLAQMVIGFQPKDWWFEFPSLQEISFEQKMNALTSFANATNIFIQNGVLSEVQVANELNENGLFANISAEDIALLEEQQDVDEFTRASSQQQADQTEAIQADQEQ
ncbi:anti-CBASS protein Acb1 family protein [Avibacterium paragallinarum]|uniref:Anti-CBASS protein Acb1-like N-terminal domain-containing protein n=1 Tax=Avibacterium paragallinarum TaxID=728 RepID=A0AAE5WGG2_AVIPA|nr:anti-CBASS Acb1 family protein [Avibacterium paragallinarum]MEE3609690.1 anti-CBASS Acb1 family protein [Avibacterium paragallinarum]MEE3621751.1 anti-CBASS Acb1 family protein [Avibacterium paragallinarum]MEE3669499.1 anti-CBASS Acb1 family protein [Avibacterium paragallinarum]MEE3681779.1 anti-CBASS Acb1 family protein [Avibacterium paragallinarum]MEE4387027.1 anti-CBASS Acb1 family protein [Avibacterium paragallinarum]